VGESKRLVWGKVARINGLLTLLESPFSNIYIYMFCIFIKTSEER